MKVLSVRSVSERLAIWVEQNPPAHAAAYRILSRISRNAQAGVPASFVAPIKPEELAAYHPSMRRLWQAIRQLPAEPRELIVMHPDLLMQREEILAAATEETAQVLSFHVPRDIRGARSRGAASATLLWLGTFS